MINPFRPKAAHVEWRFNETLTHSVRPLRIWNGDAMKDFDTVSRKSGRLNNISSCCHGHPEIIVQIRSVGTGLLSCAFHYDYRTLC